MSSMRKAFRPIGSPALAIGQLAPSQPSLRPVFAILSRVPNRVSPNNSNVPVFLAAVRVYSCEIVKLVPRGNVSDLIIGHSICLSAQQAFEKLRDFQRSSLQIYHSMFWPRAGYYLIHHAVVHTQGPCQVPAYKSALSTLWIMGLVPATVAPVTRTMFFMSIISLIQYTGLSC